MTWSKKSFFQQSRESNSKTSIWPGFEFIRNFSMPTLSACKFQEDPIKSNQDMLMKKLNRGFTSIQGA